jgi:hypothetical protein
VIHHPVYEAAGYESLWCAPLHGWLLVDAHIPSDPGQIHPVEAWAALEQEELDIVKAELESPFEDLATGKRKAIHDRHRRLGFVTETLMALAEKHRRFPASAFQEATDAPAADAS